LDLEEDLGTTFFQKKYKGTRPKIILINMAKVTKTKHEFRGSKIVLVIALLFGLIPGLLYYFLKRETIQVTEEE